MGIIIQDRIKREKFLTESLELAAVYMNKKNLDNSLKIRVKKYLEYTNEENKIAYYKGKEIIDSLSISIKNEIYENVNGKAIRKINSLFKNFSKECLDALALKMKEKNYGPEDIVLTKTEGFRNIYLLSHGKLEVLLERNLKPIRILSVNTHNLYIFYYIIYYVFEIFFNFFFVFFLNY